MTVGVIAHAPASPVSTDDDATSLLEEVCHYAQQIVQMAQHEATKPRSAVNLTRLRQIADELGETFDLLRTGPGPR